MEVREAKEDELKEMTEQKLKDITKWNTFFAKEIERIGNDKELDEKTKKLLIFANILMMKTDKGTLVGEELEKQGFFKKLDELSKKKDD